MLKTITCILKYHDDLSQESVFGTTDADRQTAFTKAEAIRTLISKIRDEVVNKKDKDKFQAIIKDHTEAMSRGLLWNRKVDFGND